MIPFRPRLLACRKGAWTASALSQIAAVPLAADGEGCADTPGRRAFVLGELQQRLTRRIVRAASGLGAARVCGRRRNVFFKRLPCRRPQSDARSLAPSPAPPTEISAASFELKSLASTKNRLCGIKALPRLPAPATQSAL